MKRAELFTQWARFCLLLSWAVLPIAISWQVFYGPAHLRGYLDTKLKPAEEWVAGAAKKANKLLDSTQEYVDDNHDATVAITRSTAATVRHLDDFVIDMNANVNGGEDTQGHIKGGLVGDLHATLQTARNTIESTRDDVHTLLVTGNESAKALSAVLTNAASLTSTLETQVKEGSPKVQETITALTKALQDADKLIADENLAGTLKNLNTTTYHLGEGAKSVDMALQSLRKKVGLIKAILSKAVEMVKFTFPIP